MFGYNATRSTEFYPLSLHDALPICEDLQPDDVLVRLAGTLGGGTAGVVADHPAQCAVAVSGRPGAEFQTVRLELRVQLIQDDPGLHHAGLRLRVDRDQSIAVFRPVDDHGDVGALPTKAGASASGQHGRAVPSAHVDG